jgi:phage terminase small subunit
MAGCNNSGQHVLNAREQRFVDHFMGNATQAAIAAGYSPKGARRAGSRLMKKEHVVAAIEGQRAKASEVAQVTRANVVAQLWQLATLPAQETRGSINGQVRALREISEILGLKIPWTHMMRQFAGRTERS